MKGLLHRLAARAAGTALPVRSNAGLPYSGGLVWLGEALSANIGSVPGPFSAAAPLPSDDAIQPAEPASTRVKVVRSTQAATEIHAGEPALPSPAYPHSTAMLPGTMRPTAEPSAAPRVPVSERHAGAQSPIEPDSPPREVARRLAPSLPVESDQPRLAPAAAHLSNVSSRRTIRPPPAAPALLMPPTFAHVDASLAIAAPQKMPPPLGPERQAHDDTTEVHIHIGRIDVTAMHEAPAPRPRPKQRPAPRSLDAYLAARSKT